MSRAEYRCGKVFLYAPYGGLLCSKHSLIATANPEKITKAKENLMKFRPLHDRVVVKRIDAEDKDRWRHHHSGYGQGEALAGRDFRRSVRAVATRPASSFRSISRSAIACCSANGPATRSRSTASRNSDHEGKRHHGRSHRSARRQEESRVSASSSPHPEESARRRLEGSARNSILIPKELAQLRGLWDLTS